MNDHTHDSISKSVLDTIRSGSVRRRSHTFFMLRMVAVVLLISLLIILSVFVASLVLFTLHESGEQFLLGYGVRGVQMFLGLFPWGFLALDLLALAGLEWLLRDFSFSYRIPVLPIFAGLLAASIAIGAIVSVTPFHDQLFRQQRTHGLPVVGAAYGHILDRHDEKGLFRGVVTEVGTSSLIMKHDDLDKDPDDGVYHVSLPMSVEGGPVQVGDRVLIFGHIGTNGIEAEHIRALPPL
jgi:hypothetical protein